MADAPVLVIVAHPDDEVLGAGGTLARLARAGRAVRPVFLANGTGARGTDAAAAERRAGAARNAAAILGLEPPVFMDFPDNRLDNLDLLDLTQAIEAIIADLRPVEIYTHHAGDLNIDHVLCHRAVMTACRPMPGASVRRIYAMEVASSTEWMTPAAAHSFLPSRFVDISDFTDAKRRALEAYAEEMRPFPHPRSYEAVEALTRWRGASAGFAAAEAFVVLRQLEPA